jgi:hypothetical protein
MQNNGDVGLKRAEKAQAQIREKKDLLLSKEKTHVKQNERFRSMTGITLREKSFRNMIDFNKHKLLKILKSEDQHAAIMKLSSTVRKTLIKHGIITKRWRDNEITEPAQEYLAIKNPADEL